MLAEGDFVVAKWSAAGTHLGRWGGAEPTGRPMSFSGVNVFRFEDAKVAELWNFRDGFGLMQQLGVSIYAGAAPGDAS